MNFGPPASLRSMDVEIRGRTLVITVRRDYERESGNETWSGAIIASCPGPYEAIMIDLQGMNMVPSSFFAGTMRLLDHYRSPGLNSIILLRVSDRVARTIDMMNIRQFYVVRQHGVEGS